MNNLKEELTDSLSELIEFLSEYKEQHNVKYFIETLKNIMYQKVLVIMIGLS